MLTLAAQSHLLASKVSDIQGVQADTVELLSRWAFPGSCIEGMLRIVAALREKHHFLQGVHQVDE